MKKELRTILLRREGVEHQKVLNISLIRIHWFYWPLTPCLKRYCHGVSLWKWLLQHFADFFMSQAIWNALTSEVDSMITQGQQPNQTATCEHLRSQSHGRFWPVFGSIWCVKASQSLHISTFGCLNTESVGAPGEEEVQRRAKELEASVVWYPYVDPFPTMMVPVGLVTSGSRKLGATAATAATPIAGPWKIWPQEAWGPTVGEQSSIGIAKC